VPSSLRASVPPISVLAGGPDAERDISITSAKAVHAALRQAGLDAELHTIDRPTHDDLRPLIHNTTVFPVLHGPWGEGGPLQSLLETLAVPYVGAGPAAARLAMDKLATKLAAAATGLHTAPAAVLNPADDTPPLPYPLIIKPTHEGSSVGLHICHTPADFANALASIRDPGPHQTPEISNANLRVPPTYLIERLITGRELTVPLLDTGSGLAPLPPIEITPASGTYDYAAKYERDDTRYTVAPSLPPALADRLNQDALALARALDLRDLARVDFIVTQEGVPTLLEVNTMPGFTPTSLLPKAAAHAGIPMPELCRTLVAAARTRGPMSQRTP